MKDLAERALAALVVIATVGGASLLFYEAYVPGPTTEAVATVLAPEDPQDRAATPPRYLLLELADGTRVRADVDAFVSATPGDRVVVADVTTPLLHRHRYRYERPVAPGGHPPAPAERPTVGAAR